MADRLKKDALGRSLPKFRKGDKVMLRPRRKGGKVHYGVVDSQPKSGNRASVWVRFDPNVVGSGTGLYMAPVADLRLVKPRR